MYWQNEALTYVFSNNKLQKLLLTYLIWKFYAFQLLIFQLCGKRDRQRGGEGERKRRKNYLKTIMIHFYDHLEEEILFGLFNPMESVRMYVKYLVWCGSHSCQSHKNIMNDKGGNYGKFQFI